MIRPDLAVLPIGQQGVAEELINGKKARTYREVAERTYFRVRLNKSKLNAFACYRLNLRGQFFDLSALLVIGRGYHQSQ